MVRVAERWTGLTWSIQSPASPDDCQDTQSGSCANGLERVSCTATTVCTAVGGFAEVTLAKRWNGSKWSTQSTPNLPDPRPPSNLNEAPCASATRPAVLSAAMCWPAL
jgi:hypothetical protein